MNMKRMRGRGHRPVAAAVAVAVGPAAVPGRHHGGGIPLNRNHVFDSNGPDIRIRGTAQQLFEKYLQLGRDATSSGDRVMAESYFQHAEHYFRILNAMTQAAQQSQFGPQNGQNPPRRQYNGEENSQPMLAEGEENEDQAPGNPAPAHPSQVPPPQGNSAPGTGDQPEPRDIPIAAAPPES